MSWALAGAGHLPLAGWVENIGKVILAWKRGNFGLEVCLKNFSKLQIPNANLASVDSAQLYF